MLRIEEVEKHKWVFVYPSKLRKLEDRFFQAADLWQKGNINSAQKIYQEIIKKAPEFIDVYDQLAVIYGEKGELRLAFENWLKGYQLGMEALPQNFVAGQDLLEWGWLENRAFLRCAYSVALYFFDRGHLAKGMELFGFIISVNPNDNQGVRSFLVEGYLKMGNYQAAIDLCGKYEDDVMVETIYGKSYALFKLGKKKEATTLLKKAIQFRPKVVKELLKKEHKQPKSKFPGAITLGGDDEAYFYWNDNGILWEEPEIREWLIENAK